MYRGWSVPQTSVSCLPFPPIPWWCFFTHGIFQRFELICVEPAYLITYGCSVHENMLYNGSTHLLAIWWYLHERVPPGVHTNLHDVVGGDLGTKWGYWCTHSHTHLITFLVHTHLQGLHYSSLT